MRISDWSSDVCSSDLDHGIYKEAQCCVLDRRSDLSEGLRPALEVWAHVQSLPEPGFAVIALGKRDVASDAGLPVPLKRYQPGADSIAGQDLAGCKVTAVMDQHAFMPVAPGGEIGRASCGERVCEYV